MTLAVVAGRSSISLAQTAAVYISKVLKYPKSESTVNHITLGTHDYTCYGFRGQIFELFPYEVNKVYDRAFYFQKTL